MIFSPNLVWNVASVRRGHACARGSPRTTGTRRARPFFDSESTMGPRGNAAGGVEETPLLASVPSEAKPLARWRTSVWALATLGALVVFALVCVGVGASLDPHSLTASAIHFDAASRAHPSRIDPPTGARGVRIFE